MLRFLLSHSSFAQISLWLSVTRCSSFNDDSFPSEWYVTVSKFLRESDYTRYDSLYFNILANLCIHHDEYTALYPDKMFWNHFYTGLEEGAAVTGMFDVQHVPKLTKCLLDMQSVDQRYLSNTALLASAAYGKAPASSNYTS